MNPPKDTNTLNKIANLEEIDCDQDNELPTVIALATEYQESKDEIEKIILGGKLIKKLGDEIAHLGVSRIIDRTSNHRIEDSLKERVELIGIQSTNDPCSNNDTIIDR